MESIEFDLMDQVEGEMWWYKGLHANLIWAVRKFCADQSCVILDAGCGTGGFLYKLHNELGRKCVGLEYSFQASCRAHIKSGAEIINASVNQMPIAPNTFDAIIFADVLYHNTVNIMAALDEAHRCLKSDGVVIINVPAYEWLRSAHDLKVHTSRRFTLTELTLLVTQAGFSVSFGTYWNTFLFPLMVLRRKIFSGAGESSDVFNYPTPVNYLFNAILKIENALFNLGLMLPFGGSVFIVAKKCPN